MTATVIGYWVHPSVCPCAGKGVIGVSAVGKVHGGTFEQSASPLASVMLCPHCRDRGDLDRFLARGEGAPLPSSDGAA